MNDLKRVIIHRECVQSYCSICAYREDCHTIAPDNFEKHMYDKYPNIRNKKDIEAIYIGHDGCFRKRDIITFSKGADMGICKCGTCNKPTKRANSDFLPGHDSKLRKQIEARVGGIFKLQELADIAEGYARGKIKSEEFTKRVRSIFSA